MTDLEQLKPPTTLAERLRAVGDKLSDEPTLYRCWHCQDTKFVCRTEESHKAPGFNYRHSNVVFSETCRHCLAGRAIRDARDHEAKLERMREDAKRARQQRRDDPWAGND